VQYDEENDPDENQGSSASAAEETGAKEEVQGAVARRSCDSPRCFLCGGTGGAGGGAVSERRKLMQ